MERFDNLSYKSVNTQNLSSSRDSVDTVVDDRKLSDINMNNSLLLDVTDNMQNSTIPQNSRLDFSIDTSDKLGDMSDKLGDTSDKLGDTSDKLGDTSDKLSDTSSLSISSDELQISDTEDSIGEIKNNTMSKYSDSTENKYIADDTNIFDVKLTLERSVNFADLEKTKQLRTLTKRIMPRASNKSNNTRKVFDSTYKTTSMNKVNVMHNVDADNSDTDSLCSCAEIENGVAIENGVVAKNSVEVENGIVAKNSVEIESCTEANNHFEFFRSNNKLPDINQNIQTITMHRQYDNIYGFITISNVAKLVITHRFFQRLKQIKQLGPLHFKFPFANHSRYEHSIGVAYLARYTGNALRNKHNTITDKEILCLELAGLCHDLGHGAYSHSFDHLLRDIKFNYKTKHHEARSQILTEYLIKDLRNVYNVLLNHNDIRLIQYFIDPDGFKHLFPNCDIPKFTQGLEQVVSNPVHKLDVDKMDYLLRDAQALRFDLTMGGKLDILGLLNRSMLVKDSLSTVSNENSKIIWMFHIRDRIIVYDLICRRFIFYNNYYLHPEVNALNCMLTDALAIVNQIYNFTSCVKLETIADVEDYIRLTDEYFLEFILNSKDPKISAALDLIDRITTNKGNANNWYKHMGDFITHIDGLDETTYAELPWEIFTDKSTPTNLLPKIRYHQNGSMVDPQNIQYVRRLYMKTHNT